MVLNAGRVEQIGTPLEVCRRPASTFVAGFIGSPPMNLLPAAALPGLAPEGRPQASSRRICNPPRRADGDAGGAVEESGSHRLIHGEIGGAQAAVAVASDFAPEVALRLAVAPGDVHLFDAATGLRHTG